MSAIDVITIVLPALFVGGFIKGAIGFGFPLVATPILLFYLTLPQIISLIFLPVLASNIQQCWLTRNSAAVLMNVWPLIAVNALVLYFGSGLIVTMDGDLIRVIVGSLIIFHALFADRAFPKGERITRSFASKAVAGGVSGALGSLSSFFSFPGVQLLYSMRLEPGAFVFSLGAFMATGFCALWAGVLMHGMGRTEGLGFSLLAVLPVIAGVWFGNRVRYLLGHRKFRALVSGMLLVVGVSLILRSL